MQQRLESLLAGELEPFIEGFSFPLPVYVPTGQVFLVSKEQARIIANVLRTSLLDRGVVAMHPKVTATELPRGGRFRVWVEWHDMAMPSGQTHLTSGIYYLKVREGGLRTEMISYESVSMPEVYAKLEKLTVSA